MKRIFKKLLLITATTALIAVNGGNLVNANAKATSVNVPPKMAEEMRGIHMRKNSRARIFIVNGDHYWIYQGKFRINGHYVTSQVAERQLARDKVSQKAKQTKKRSGYRVRAANRNVKSESRRRGRSKSANDRQNRTKRTRNQEPKIDLRKQRGQSPKRLTTRSPVNHNRTRVQLTHNQHPNHHHKLVQTGENQSSKIASIAGAIMLVTAIIVIGFDQRKNNFNNY